MSHIQCIAPTSCVYFGGKLHADFMQWPSDHRGPDLMFPKLITKVVVISNSLLKLFFYKALPIQTFERNENS